MEPGRAFARGTAFRTVRGRAEGRIDGLLGEGGQGTVYQVSVDGARFALKWYHPSYAAVDSGLRSRLARTIGRGSPDDSFLWPLDLAEMPGVASFGYIMRLRDAGHSGMRELIAPPPRRISPPLAVRAAICLRVAQSFLELHSSGFCYQDINFGNIFFRADDGDVLICDNDNVDVDGSPASVYGTRKFMAPEVVRREAMPSTRTDLFSIGVLFFYVLHAWHPLDGRREAQMRVLDAAAETSLYGTEPRFLFDPGDDGNGPLAGMHEPIVARWEALTPTLRTLFTRSFTVGLRKPFERVLEAEWRDAFAALAAATYACPRCGFEHALRREGAGSVEGPRSCVACGSALALPPVLSVGRSAVALSPGRHIPRCHIHPGQPVDLRRVAASVEAHPTRTDIWGLRNLTCDTWQAVVPGQPSFPVPPERSLRIQARTRIDFGGAVGTIIVPEPSALERGAAA